MFKQYWPEQVKGTTKGLSLKGQKPLWISTTNLKTDSKQIQQILNKAMVGFSQDALWTCFKPSSRKRYELLCGNNWVYVNVFNMDGIEATNVIFFGLPKSARDGDPSFQISRKFTRARIFFAVVTEKDEERSRYPIATKYLNM